MYRGEYFGAPIRVDADTAWMKARQIESMHLARFEEQRQAAQALDALYADADDGRDATAHAWTVALAHSRVAHPQRLALGVPGRVSCPPRRFDRYRGRRRWTLDPERRELESMAGMGALPRARRGRRYGAPAHACREPV